MDKYIGNLLIQDRWGQFSLFDLSQACVTGGGGGHSSFQCVHMRRYWANTEKHTQEKFFWGGGRESGESLLGVKTYMFSRKGSVFHYLTSNLILRLKG